MPAPGCGNAAAAQPCRWPRVAVVAADVTDPGGLAAAIAAQADPTGWPVDAALDLVVANPPYVPELTDGTPTPISPEVAADPHRAVFAGADGMAVITPMLNPCGHWDGFGTALGVEHDDATGPAVAAAMDAAGFAAIEPHATTSPERRFTTAVRDEAVSTVYDCTDPQTRSAGMRAAVAAARSSRLVVLPTDTLYGLG